MIFILNVFHWYPITQTRHQLAIWNVQYSFVLDTNPFGEMYLT